MRVIGRIGYALAAILPLAVAACVPRVSDRPGPNALHWTGTTTTAATLEDGTTCPAMVLDLFTQDLRIGGTARPVDAQPASSPLAAPIWLISGTVNQNGTFIFNLRERTSIQTGLVPDSVWRGQFPTSLLNTQFIPGTTPALPTDPATLANGAAEQPFSCGRTVIFTPATSPAVS